LTDKIFFIDHYFKHWKDNLDKAEELLRNIRYYREGMLVLSCYIGAFAAMRYGALRDGEAYVNVILEYSGMRTFFEQVDLLFFYQWPRSKLRDNGNYKRLKQHSKIVEALKCVYGTEDDIKVKTRYISPLDFISQVKSAAIPGFDELNLRKTLHLFSLAELLYRYFRCDAVHNAEFHFINEMVDIDGNVTYESGYVITSEVLLKTTQAIWETLWKEFQTEAKWPHQLG